MSKSIARRDMLTLLPAVTLCLSNADSLAQDSDRPSIQVNGADSIYYYKFLLATVRGDAYRTIGKGTAQAVADCNEALGELKEAITQLQRHLKTHPDWPRLRQRFSALDKSLTLAEGDKPDQERAEALRALPQTLTAIKELLSDVYKACNDDPDGKIAELVDHVYSQLNRQNQVIQGVDDAKALWAGRNSRIEKSYNTCDSALDDAATAIVEGTIDSRDWLMTSSSALDTAIRALDDIKGVFREANGTAPSPGAAPAGGYPQVNESSGSLDTLQGILVTTKKSLRYGLGPKVEQTSYETSQTPGAAHTPPSIKLNGDDPGLIRRVQQIVHQTDPRYFRPGIAVQTINCIAVCLPVWIVYNSDSLDDVRNRQGLIGAALESGLIYGTLLHDPLKHLLQGIYREALEALKS